MTQGFRFGPGRCCCDVVRSCEDPERPICYVDKYATGDADGTSWEDAYTTIQAAINNHNATHRIWIYGYGSGDAYVENLSCPLTAAGTSLSGIGSCWVDGYLNGGAYGCFYNLTFTGSDLYSTGYKVYDYGRSCTFVKCIVDTVAVSTGLHVFYDPLVCKYCEVKNVTSTGNYIFCFHPGSSGYNVYGKNCIIENVSCINGSVIGYYNGKWDDCSVYLILGGGGITAGFSGGARNNCTVSNITGGHYTYGFDSGTVTNCTVTSLHVEGYYDGYAYGFHNCNCTSSTCIADNVTKDKSADKAIGYKTCTNTTNCTCTTPQPADGCIVV